MMSDDYTAEEREIISEIRQLGAENVVVTWNRQLVCFDASANLRSGSQVKAQDAHRTAALENLLTSVRTGNAAT
jgi:hypothetical protein